MSMPFRVFTCSACDHQGDDTVLWGLHSYECPSGLMPVQRQLGWCPSCHLSAVEILPSEKVIRQLEECKGANRSRAQEPLRVQPSRAERDLEEERHRLEVFRGRVAKARCLFCGSQDWLPFPNDTQPTGTNRAPGPAVPIGMNHPGCTGALQVAYSHEWYEIPLPHRIFDLEGNLLRPEKPHAVRSAVAEPVIIRRNPARSVPQEPLRWWQEIWR